MLATIIYAIPSFEIGRDSGRFLSFDSYHYLFNAQIQKSAAPAAEFGIVLAIINSAYHNFIYSQIYTHKNNSHPAES